ncbi:hypothetical protein ARTHRO9AX_190125 [Arthrobacter sp. 9AX]|nr:hypothetical protein ARTHRO9AX_190125 [Arthrobacter sp. 9AX]
MTRPGYESRQRLRGGQEYARRERGMGQPGRKAPARGVRRRHAAAAVAFPMFAASSERAFEITRLLLSERLS